MFLQRNKNIFLRDKIFFVQSADRAGVEDAGDDDGQDGAGLSAGHRALQPRREGAPGHQPGGAAQGESVRHLGGVHQVITFTTICSIKS